MLQLFYERIGYIMPDINKSNSHIDDKISNKMFCFQCQQTAHNTGCTGKVGVCGKHDGTADLQDALVGRLIGLAKLCNEFKTYDEESTNLIINGMFTTLTNVSFNDTTINELIKSVIKKQESLINANQTKMPAIKDANDYNYDLHNIWYNEDLNIRSVKSMIIFGLKGMAAYAYHCRRLGYKDDRVDSFFYEALDAVGDGTAPSFNQLLKLVLKTGEINYICLDMLDKANTETYGDPVPVTVPLTIEKGPFIVVSGHDLHDLKQLLEQTKDKGINIYTHSEMLPAHGYPQLKAYKHLKGNFGTGWQNQQSEFHNIPAPILFTTNCLMPVRQSYCDRVYTTGVVSYPELIHIPDNNGKKDFTPIIEKAIECGGYDSDRQMTGMNGGHYVTTGFGHNAVLSHAEKIVQLVKEGKIRHFYLIGGCDGASPSRSYYSDLAKLTPPDTIILTLACGKYRLNDLDLGNIDGIPRILDCGQCNDSFTAITIALALADAFDCSVNDLPLTFFLSWYEQKAVCVLLTLLYLGIKNIFLGPTLPAFISPDVLDFLVKNYEIRATSTPEEDIRK